MARPINTRLLKRSDIDEDRWNAAIDRDDSCLIYGLTWWLDAATDGNWEGLILDDYRIVLALPIARKIGPLRHIARAPFTQQNGPFGNPTSEDILQLLSALPFRIKLDLPLREGLDKKNIPGHFEIREATNLVLSINRPYETVKQGYGKTLRRRLKKAGPVIFGATSPSAILELYKISSGRKARLNPTHYARMGALMLACLQREMGIFASVSDWNSEQLLANGFFPTYRGRTVHLFPGTTELGYQQDGPLRLLDAVIRLRAEKDWLFDFEGSDLPGVAALFRRFKPALRGYLRIS